MRETLSNYQLSQDEAIAVSAQPITEPVTCYRWCKTSEDTQTDGPRTRAKHASCVHGNYVYVYGGRDNNLCLKDFWKFNLLSKQWELISTTGDSLPRLEGHSIVSHKNELYIFGGEFSPSLDETPLWIYNTETTEIIHHKGEKSTPHPAGRRGHSAVVHKENLYIYGGFVDMKGSSAEFWTLNTAEQRWESLGPCPGDSPGAQSLTPGARHGHTCVVYAGNMWLYGGMTDLIPKAELWKWNFGTEQWQQIRCRFGPPALHSHTANVIGGSMYIFGGDSLGQLQSDLWRLDFAAVSWEKITHSGPVIDTMSHHTSICIMPFHEEDKSPSNTRSRSVPAIRRTQIVTDLRQRPYTSPAGYRTNDNSDTSAINKEVNSETTSHVHGPVYPIAFQNKITPNVSTEQLEKLTTSVETFQLTSSTSEIEAIELRTFSRKPEKHRLLSESNDALQAHFGCHGESDNLAFASSLSNLATVSSNQNCPIGVLVDVVSDESLEHKVLLDTRVSLRQRNMELGSKWQSYVCGDDVTEYDKPVTTETHKKRYSYNADDLIIVDLESDDHLNLANCQEFSLFNNEELFPRSDEQLTDRNTYEMSMKSHVFCDMTDNLPASDVPTLTDYSDVVRCFEQESAIVCDDVDDVTVWRSEDSPKTTKAVRRSGSSPVKESKKLYKETEPTFQSSPLPAHCTLMILGGRVTGDRHLSYSPLTMWECHLPFS